MDISGSVALVTGANGGIGRAFVAELLKRGAAKIYVAARDPASLSDLLKDDGRLVPLRLDVTDSAEVAAAATAAPDVTLLVNNAGYVAFQGAIAAPQSRHRDASDENSNQTYQDTERRGIIMLGMSLTTFTLSPHLTARKRK
jgi:NAD(P)-dependent dehydrogenase (short-subunit alcohol dehydrogenase family)